MPNTPELLMIYTELASQFAQPPEKLDLRRKSPLLLNLYDDRLIANWLMRRGR